MLIFSPNERVEPGSRHEGCSDGFDLFNIPELWFIQQLVEVADEFVEYPEVLLPAHVGLVVQLVEVD